MASKMSNITLNMNLFMFFLFFIIAIYVVITGDKPWRSALLLMPAFSLFVYFDNKKREIYVDGNSLIYRRGFFGLKIVPLNRIIEVQYLEGKCFYIIFDNRKSLGNLRSFTKLQSLKDDIESAMKKTDIKRH